MDTATKMRSNGGKARAKLDKAVLAEIGRKGGKARAAAMEPAERSDAARKAVNKRWADVRAAKQAELKAAKPKPRSRRRRAA